MSKPVSLVGRIPATPCFMVAAEFKPDPKTLEKGFRPLDRLRPRSYTVT
jgi:hypothetical protein